MIPKFFGTIKDGKLQLKARTALRGYLRSLEGKEVVLTVEEKRSRKTMPQLAYFHGVIAKLVSDHTGYTLHETKEALKDALLPRKRIMLASGRQVEILPSLGDMGKEDMSRFIDDAIGLAAELGVVIPDPNNVRV